jgi:hypothetical protein
MAFDPRRWYTIEAFDNRSDAVEYARKRKREEDSRGYKRTYRIRKGNGSRWVVENAAPLSESEMRMTRHYNRRSRETESGQRRLGL